MKSNVDARVLLFIAAAACAACTKDQPASLSVGPDPAVATATAQSSDPPAPSQARPASVTGTVAETIDAASYTYVRLTTPQGDQWAAVPQTQLAVGATVTIANPMVMEEFESPSLKRKFDRILFGTLGGGGAASGLNPHAGLPGGGTTASPAASPGPPLPKATGPNAHTVAEVLAGKTTLKDKLVTVRGRVTKFNASIMGKNWLHLDDGSVKGASDPTIAVTSADTASVGDVVVVQGIVHTDKDFGAGYAYPVMIEEATITK